MREILFKAKRIDNGEWVEGWIVPTMHNTYHYGYRIIETCGINYDELDFWEPSFISWEVDENTICQFTGLTDKRGNKIWENDVVRCYADTDDLGNDLYFFYQILWHELYHCWWLSDVHTLEDEYLHQYISSDIEVIGNIFENPELLGEQNG